ncbi:hypothetical protein HN51_032148 [Arachis hypogaea]
MGQIGKRKKKGRPSKADLARRSAESQSAEQSDIRRSLRRRNVRYNIIEYDDDYLDEDEDERRREKKKLKLVEKLNSDDDEEEAAARGKRQKSGFERAPQCFRKTLMVCLQSWLIQKRSLQLQDVIEHPMDFATVRKKLANGSYSTLEQFEFSGFCKIGELVSNVSANILQVLRSLLVHENVFLICSNAMQYNAPDTIYHKQARAIQEPRGGGWGEFEKLRIAFECSQAELKPEQKSRSNALVKKPGKRPPGRPSQEPIGSNARSLARFSASLGLIAWKVASQKIQQTLPDGYKFGHGWVGVYEPLSTPGLMFNNHIQKDDSLVRKLHSSSEFIKGDRNCKIVEPTVEHHGNGQVFQGKQSSICPPNGLASEGKPFLFGSGGIRPNTSADLDNLDNQKQECPIEEFQQV